MKKTFAIVAALTFAAALAAAEPVKAAPDCAADTVARQQQTAETEPLKSSKWKGKKIGFLGNSITEQGRYVSAYAALTGCKAKNYGKSGTHMAKRNADDTLSFDCRYAKMPDDLDMVIVFGGTNDFGHEQTAPFGQFSDGPDPNKNTFYAGLHRLFRGLSLKYRDKPVVVMTPVHHGTELDVPEYKTGAHGALEEIKNPTSGKTFKEYVDAIKEVAAFYSLPVIDAYSSSGLTPFTEIGKNHRYYFADGLHPNARGGMKLARWMYPQLELIYDMFY